MSTIEATRCGVAGWITRIFPIFVLNCWYCSKNIDEYFKLYKKESPNAVVHFSDVGGSITGGGKQAHANHRTHQSPFYNNLFIFFLLSSLCILSFYFCLFLFVFEEIMNGRRPPSEQWLPRWQSVIPAPLYFSSSHLCTSLYFSSPDLCYSVYFSYLQFLSFYLFTSHHLIFVLFVLFTSISLLLSSVCLFVSLIFASFFLYYSLPTFFSPLYFCVSHFHIMHFSYSHILHSIILITSPRECCMVKLTKSNLQQKWKGKPGYRAMSAQKCISASSPNANGRVAWTFFGLEVVVFTQLQQNVHVLRSWYFEGWHAPCPWKQGWKMIISSNY